MKQTTSGLATSVRFTSFHFNLTSMGQGNSITTYSEFTRKAHNYGDKIRQLFNSWLVRS